MTLWPPNTAIIMVSKELLWQEEYPGSKIYQKFSFVIFSGHLIGSSLHEQSSNWSLAGICHSMNVSYIRWSGIYCTIAFDYVCHSIRVLCITWSCINCTSSFDYVCHSIKVSYIRWSGIYCTSAFNYVCHSIKVSYIRYLAYTVQVILIIFVTP